MHPVTTPQDESTPLLVTGSSLLKEGTVYIYLVACLSAIGGFLFGYDTGIISGAMIFIRETFELNEWWQESIVSSTLLAAWMFSIMSGSLNDRFGRKMVILGSSLVFVMGSLLMAFAGGTVMLLLGRLVVGAGVGLASMTVPMYIAEVAPSTIRGQLVMINMVCITGGQFFASLIAYGFSFVDESHGWRLMLGFAALPAGIQFLAFLAMPESPRWLVAKRRYQEARDALLKMRPASSNTELEFESIRRNCLQAKRDQEAQMETDQNVMQRVLANQPVRKALLVGCLLQLVQQGSGINTVMYYSASIFEMSGVHSKQEALILSALTALINFLCTLVGYALVERAGRRRLILLSLAGVVVGLLTLGAGFQFAYTYSPQVTEIDHSALNAPCDQYKSCAICVRDPRCGFCFSETEGNAANLVHSAGCYHANTSHYDQALLGHCQTGSTDSHIWAYEWCPSNYSWLTLLGMGLYLFFFAPGMGPMPWTINSEIYPSWARSFCLSVSTSTNWLANLLVAMTFLSLTSAITKQGAFYLYAGVAVAGFIYFAWVLPETKGRSLEELEEIFASDQWLRDRHLNRTNGTPPGKSQILASEATGRDQL